MSRIDMTLTQHNATSTGLIARFWAQQKVADLSSDVDANKDALAAVGKEFNLVTPNTSLLFPFDSDLLLDPGFSVDPAIP